METREQIEIEAAKAEGRVEATMHLLDLVDVILANDLARERMKKAAAEVLALYRRKHVQSIEKFVEVVRGDLRRGVVMKVKAYR